MKVVAPTLILTVLMEGGAVALQCYRHGDWDCAKENCLVENNKVNCTGLPKEHEQWCAKGFGDCRFALNN